MHRRTLFTVWLTAFLPTTAGAASYTVADLGTLGGSYSYGTGINASGQVTGQSSRADGISRAFLYDGTMHDIGPFGTGALDSATSAGYGINNSGQVTGDADFQPGVAIHAFFYDGAMHDLGTPDETYTGSAGRGINSSGHVAGSSSYITHIDESGEGDYSTSRAFIYDGTWHDLGTLGGTASEVFAINDSDQATGRAFTTGDAATHAFLYDGTMHDLGTLGGTGSEAFGINSSGQIVGGASTTDDAAMHAFLYNGTMHDLGTLGGTSSEALGINSSGRVTGWSGVSPEGDYHAFVYDASAGLLDLNSRIDPASGWFLRYGNAINDVGQITGTGLIGGQEHAFLLTPVPEPSSLLLAVLSAICLVYCAVRRLVPKSVWPA